MASAQAAAGGVAPARVRMMESLKCDQLRAVLASLRLSKQGNKGALQERVLAALVHSSPRERAAAEKAVADVYAAATATPVGLPTTAHTGGAPSPPPLAHHPSLSAATMQPWEARALEAARESDPFWTAARGTASVCLLPTRLAVVPGHRASGWAGPPPVLTQAERAFAVPPDDVALLRRCGGAYALHFFCVRLDDPVRYRLHWPCHASLTVSGVTLAVPCRTASHDLGPGGRDPPAVAPPALLAQVLSGAPLRLTVAGYDSRPFAVLAYVARARAMAEVEAQVPPAAPFVEALRSACTAVRGDDAGGGGAGGNASDGDDVAEMRVDALPLSLRDPISGARVAHPVRFVGCTGLAVFDLRTFLTVTQRSRRWQCPRCAACGGPGALRRDSFVAALLAASAALEDVDDVEVNREGHWRPRLPSGAFGRWVSPEETQAAARLGAPRLQLGPSAAPGDIKPDRDDDAPPAAAAPAYTRADVAEVIDLCGETSDDDDDDDVPSKRARFTPQPPPPATQPQAAPPPPGGPLRVRLAAPAEAHLVPRTHPTAAAPSMPSLYPVLPTAAMPGATLTSLSAREGAAGASAEGSASVCGGVLASSAALRRPSFPFAAGAPSLSALVAARVEQARLEANLLDDILRGPRSTAPDADGWRHRRPAAPPLDPETIEIDD